MANLYSPDQLGIKPTTTGGVFKNGAWYNGRMYFNGTLTDPGVVHPDMGGVGAGQVVSSEVNRQSDPLQNLQPGGIDAYLESQRQKAPTVVPSSNITSNGSRGTTSAVTSNGGAEIGTVLGTGGLLGGAPTINLPDLYKSIYKDSGIEAIQADLSAKEKGYNDAVSKINDNPYLSEATRVGRVQKLSTDYQNSVASLKNDVTTKKADIEMKMNLESKQFDINSEQAKTAFNQFNSLLEMGALDGASGDEIAAITMTTGLPSALIYSAINANKAKNVKTETIKWDDGVNQGFAVVNSATGEIISKQAVAASDTTSKSGAGSLSTTQKRSYTADAIKILNEVDSQYRVDKSGKAVQLDPAFKDENKGDKLLSRSEMELARQRIIEMSGGDEELGKQLFQDAMVGGAFKIYGN